MMLRPATKATAPSTFSAFLGQPALFLPLLLVSAMALAAPVRMGVSQPLFAGRTQLQPFSPFTPAFSFFHVRSVPIAGVSAPTGEVGRPYSFDVASLPQARVGGVRHPSDATWTVGSGHMPAGLDISPDGVITGVPQVQGTSIVQVRALIVTSEGVKTEDLTLSLTIVPASPSRNKL